jgi:hypothetical protein
MLIVAISSWQSAKTKFNRKGRKYRNKNREFTAEESSRAF